jgi:hypothetical protein
MLHDLQIRPLGPDDDFSRLNELIRQTLKKSLEAEKIQPKYFLKPARLRQMFLPRESTDGPSEEPVGKAFLAEQNGQVVAFMGVQFSEETKNGYLIYGSVEGDEKPIAALLEKCEQAVRQAGGRQLCRFITMRSGKIRNDEISFWEKHGFIADHYFHALIKLEVNEWETPDRLDTHNIVPASDVDLEQIMAILGEDEQDELAREFRENFSEKTPDHVFLKLLNDQGETAAISYYQVIPFSDRGPSGKKYEGLGAFSAGIHFRPKYSLTRKEKRRFIRGTIQSMKQLNVIFAVARISSKDFDAFIEMLAEGFYFQGDVPAYQVRLTKRV